MLVLAAQPANRASMASRARRLAEEGFNRDMLVAQVLCVLKAAAGTKATGVAHHVEQRQDGRGMGSAR